jgi:hypothetical protein
LPSRESRARPARTLRLLRFAENDRKNDARISGQ